MAPQSIAPGAAEGKGEGITRQERGIALFRDKGHEIDWLSDGTFSVPGTEEGVLYDVDLRVGETGVCSCPDFQRRRAACKHIYAAELRRVQLLRKARKEAAERKRRAEAEKEERITFSPEQVLATLDRLGP
jgi:uncharacterized Zn finger protein